MTDCIIVGGGIIGMLTARELSAAGADVLLLERARLGGESSWAGGGILSPLYPWRYADSVNALAKFSQRIYPSIAEDLITETGIDPEFNRCGLLVLDQDENDQAMGWAEQWDMQLAFLDSVEAVHQREPELNSAYSRANWLPEIAQMRNPRLVKALAASLPGKNITVVEHCDIQQLLVHQGAIQGVQSADSIYKADKVIVAGGAWSAQIVGEQQQPPAIEPVKGQMILFKAAPGLLRTMVLSGGRYLIPRRDGRILAGSTLEHTGFEKQTTDDAMQSLRQSAINLIPALAEFDIEHHWAGLRPGTDQGIPYICQHPEIKGLYINSGHYRNGVILGAASARLMSELVTGKPAELDITPYGFEKEH